jgi:hypothetical protein
MTNYKAPIAKLNLALYAKKLILPLNVGILNNIREASIILALLLTLYGDKSI